MGLQDLELIVFVGLQGAGKSTLYRERFASTHRHISKDNFRNNKNRARRQAQIIKEALGSGFSAVVDNTNVTIADRTALIELARQYNARTIGYFFVPDLPGSLERNAGRTGLARVPDVALYVTNAKLEPPTYAEGFDELWTVELTEAGLKLELLEKNEDG